MRRRLSQINRRRIFQTKDLLTEEERGGGKNNVNISRKTSNECHILTPSFQTPSDVHRFSPTQRFFTHTTPIPSPIFIQFSKDWESICTHPTPLEWKTQQEQNRTARKISVENSFPWGKFSIINYLNIRRVKTSK